VQIDSSGPKDVTVQVDDDRPASATALQHTKKKKETHT
jgi:hypothetical protein